MFLLFFSLVGTVLGGIWADQSWGRFWGWDAKENGALLIVIWNAIILHARWAGVAKIVGLSALAIFGNVVTAWSGLAPICSVWVCMPMVSWKAFMPLMIFIGAWVAVIGLASACPRRFAYPKEAYPGNLIHRCLNTELLPWSSYRS